MWSLFIGSGLSCFVSTDETVQKVNKSAPLNFQSNKFEFNFVNLSLELCRNVVFIQTIRLHALHILLLCTFFKFAMLVALF